MKLTNLIHLVSVILVMGCADDNPTLGDSNLDDAGLSDSGSDMDTGGALDVGADLTGSNDLGSEQDLGSNDLGSEQDLGCDMTDCDVACDAGYTELGNVCVDIDECADGTDDCATGATCGNIDGGFECSCPVGQVVSFGECQAVLVSNTWQFSDTIPAGQESMTLQLTSPNLPMNVVPFISARTAGTDAGVAQLRVRILPDGNVVVDRLVTTAAVEFTLSVVEFNPAMVDVLQIEKALTSGSIALPAGVDPLSLQRSFVVPTFRVAASDERSRRMQIYPQREDLVRMIPSHLYGQVAGTPPAGGFETNTFLVRAIEPVFLVHHDTVDVLGTTTSMTKSIVSGDLNKTLVLSQSGPHGEVNVQGTQLRCELVPSNPKPYQITCTRGAPEDLGSRGHLQIVRFVDQDLEITHSTVKLDQTNSATASVPAAGRLYTVVPGVGGAGWGSLTFSGTADASMAMPMISYDDAVGSESVRVERGGMDGVIDVPVQLIAWD